MNDLRERLADDMEDAIDNVHDLDVTVRDYAKACAEVAAAEIERLTALLEDRSTSAFEFLTEGDAKEILHTLSKAQCLPCLGTGERNDAAPGDISFNSWVCPDCEGKGWNKQAVHEITAAHKGTQR